MKNRRSIRSLFTVPGFVAASRLQGVFGDRYARVIRLTRRKKPLSARIVDIAAGDATTGRWCGFAISRWPGGGSTSSSSAGASTVRGVAACM